MPINNSSETSPETSYSEPVAISHEEAIAKLNHAAQLIQAMQSSKFWKLRTFWTQTKARLRSKLGASPAPELIPGEIDTTQFTDLKLHSKLTPSDESSWQKTARLQSNNSQLTDALFYKEGRRHAVISRIEFTKFYREEFQKEPWTPLANEAYKTCQSPSITVLITLFNYARHIEQCLDSVSSSHTSKLPGGVEVIIVDDCSTDDSAEVAAAYVEQSNLPMCLVKKKLNTGLADARNTGIQLARAEHIFMLDADNWVYPNCFERLYQEIHGSDYAAIYSMIRRFEDGTDQDLGFVSAEDWSIQKLVKQPYIDAMAIFSRQALLSIGNYSTNLIYYGWFGWDDYDVWLKLAQKGHTCKYLPEVLCSYRVHSGSMINTTNYYTRNIAKHFMQKFADLARQYGQSDMIFGFSPEELQ